MFTLPEYLLSLNKVKFPSNRNPLVLPVVYTFSALSCFFSGHFKIFTIRNVNE